MIGSIKERRFFWLIMATTGLQTVLWFFAVWIASRYVDNAVIYGAFLLPAMALPICVLPQERRAWCTELDLKMLSYTGRGVLGFTAVFAALVLTPLWHILPQDFLDHGLFRMLIGQFALHVFGVILFANIALLAPKDARKKPLRLAFIIYLVSTIMQFMTFSATMTLLR